MINYLKLSKTLYNIFLIPYALPIIVPSDYFLININYSCFLTKLDIHILYYIGNIQKKYSSYLKVIPHIRCNSEKKLVTYLSPCIYWWNQYALLKQCWYASP